MHPASMSNSVKSSGSLSLRLPSSYGSFSLINLAPETARSEETALDWLVWSEPLFSAYSLILPLAQGEFDRSLSTDFWKRTPVLRKDSSQWRLALDLSRNSKHC